LNHFDYEVKMANMGYWIRTGETNRGTATSAALLLARFGFEALKLNRIEILVSTENKPSQKVAEKIGAMREGALRRRMVVRDKVYDAVLYSLIPEDLA
jgi:RimJ/RimL family protein N-acetyltransferase